MILMLIVPLLLCAAVVEARSMRTGDQVATFSLPGIGGKRVDSSVNRGNVIVYYFWSDACGCREQLLALRDFVRSMKKRPFRFVTINVAQDARKVAAFVANQSLPYEVLLDEKAELSRETFGVRVLPTILVVSRDGVLREKLVGVIDTKKTGGDNQTLFVDGNGDAGQASPFFTRPRNRRQSTLPRPPGTAGNRETGQ